MATKRIRGDRWEFTIKRKNILDRPFSISFDTEAEGIAVCARMEQELDAGIIPPEIRDRATANKDKVETILQAVRRYELAMSVPDSERLLLDTVVGQIGHIRLERVTYPWVEAWITDLKREQVLAPTTIRHYVGALGRCLDYHVRRETIERNPIRLLPKKFASYNDADRLAVQAKGESARYDVTRDRRLDELEEPRIRAVLSGSPMPGISVRPVLVDNRAALTLVFELALETSMRMREIYTLTRAQVNLAKRTVYLERTKNGSSRQVPLSSVALAKFKSYFASFVRPLSPSELLFPWWSGNHENKELRSVSSDLSKQFAKVFEAAGCPDLHFHDLRHEAICRLFERTTLQPMMIARISGHSSPKLLQRYLSLRGSDLAEHLW